jgi:hypothetical protein
MSRPRTIAETSGIGLARVWRARWFKVPLSWSSRLKVKIADHRLDTSLLRRTEILPRQPFKAVARVQIPLGPPTKEQVRDRAEIRRSC